MSTVKTVKYQVGTDGTSTNNFTIYQPDPPDGSIRIGVGNADSPTDVMTVNSSGITMASGKTIPASALTGSLPAGMGGKILQVLQTTKTDTFSTQSTAPVDITGFSVSITPSSTSSKFLVSCNSYISNSGYNGYVFLLRDSSQIFTADAAGTRPATSGCVGGYSASSMIYSLNSSAISYLDSPNTTSQVTYKLQMSSYSTSHTSYMNRTHADRDTSAYEPRAASSITVMEIAG